MEDVGSGRFKFSSYESRIRHAKALEFSRLQDVVYLDHAATTLYAESQIKKYADGLVSNLYGNPHSNNSSSQATTDAVDEVRHRVLQWLNTDQHTYSVVFTSGCTASLKLVGECFQYSNGTRPSHRKSHDTRSRTEGENYQKADTACTHFETDDLNGSDSVAAAAGICSEYTQRLHPNDAAECRSDGDKSCCGERCCSCCQQSGMLVYTEDCHTSVLGMRLLAKQHGAKVKCLTSAQLKPHLTTSTPIHTLTGTEQAKCFQTDGRGLFVYAAESNFSGTKYPLEWISQVQGQGHWYVLIDAATYLGTCALDLSTYQPEFVALSFHKVFGFPTGLGALLIRNSSAHVLDKQYFGGGTVQVATSDFHAYRTDISERFEDGTIPFLDILALKYSFDSWLSIVGNISNITKCTYILAKYVYEHLILFRHGNDTPVAEVYEDTGFASMETQGAVISFNLLHSDRTYVGYSAVDKLAHAYDIELRVGCFCNMGACQSHLQLSQEKIINNFKSGHVCGDDIDILDGSPTGAIRISFGYTSTLADADAFLKFIRESFIEDSTTEHSGITSANSHNHSETILKRILSEVEDEILDTNIAHTLNGGKASEKSAAAESLPTKTADKYENASDRKGENFPTNLIDQDFKGDIPRSLENVTSKEIQADGTRATDMTLREICVYPVKSCSAFKVMSWSICDQGLLYDRQWMIIMHNGIPLTQKRATQMCLIRPYIDLLRGILTLTFPGMPDVSIPLEPAGGEESAIQVCQSKVCGDKVSVCDCGEEVALWLQDVLGRPGLHLVKQNDQEVRQAMLKPKGMMEGANLSLANSGQYLLINQRSVESIQSHIVSCAVHQDEENQMSIEEMVCRFRTNLLVDAYPPFIEDTWKKITIGQKEFLVAGACSRCQMVCVDQNSGVRGRQPLKAISATRGTKMEFGILLQHCCSGEESRKLSVGDKIMVHQNRQ